jgi:hypothetical protein
MGAVDESITLPAERPQHASSGASRFSSVRADVSDAPTLHTLFIEIRWTHSTALVRGLRQPWTGAVL